MNCQISDIERKVLVVLQEGFPASRSPYSDMAKSAGLETRRLLAILEDWKRSGKIRRIGAIINHLKINLSGAAMVAWQVEPERVEQVGNILAQYSQVSHAYERQTAENWPYNVYTMIHVADIEQINEIVEQMSQRCGVSKFRILATEKELKKVPPKYINTDYQ
ncbi:MAG: hypothetical protein JW715_08430 [Sedimentisphaerales bacterium]|nr:hypothetical protein [Sedimentisphaerales bacterium]